MATSEGIPSSIDIEFLELNDNPYSRTDGFCEVASYLTTWTYDKMASQNRSFTLVYI